MPNFTRKYVFYITIDSSNLDLERDFLFIFHLFYQIPCKNYYEDGRI